MISRFHLIVYSIFLIAFGILLFYIKILVNKTENLESFKSTYQTEGQSKSWQAKDSSWHNKAQDAEVTKSELEYLKELQGLHSEFDGVKKSLKNLENYTGFSETTTIHKTIKLKDSTIYNIDSSSLTHTYKFDYKTKWDQISGSILGDSVDLKVTHNDSLEVVQYWDRKWLLGKKKYFTEIKSENPNTKINYQRSIKTQRKRGLF